jgi:hypothetical protein
VRPRMALNWPEQSTPLGMSQCGRGDPPVAISRAPGATPPAHDLELPASSAPAGWRAMLERVARRWFLPGRWGEHYGALTPAAATVGPKAHPAVP